MMKSSEGHRMVKLSLSNYTIGLVALIGFTVIGLIIFNKEELTARFSAMIGQTVPVKAEFARDYKLREYRAGSTVKMSGVQVGLITDIAHNPTGTVVVTMQVDPLVRDKLGSAPSAHIRPTLVLGGRYYIDLVPGGAPGPYRGGVIPLSRTTIPVEVEHVLEAVGTAAPQRGIQSSVRQLDATLANGGTPALQDLFRDAPATLAPAGDTLGALRGTRPDSDLAEMVTGLRNLGVGLDHHNAQIDSIVHNVDRTTAALAAASRPLASSLDQMPDTLRATRAGMADLQPSLKQLETTASDFHDSARALDPLTAELQPALREVRPLVRELRPVLHDAQPLVERLRPLASRGTDVLDDLEGPVLNRVEGPIARTVLSPWRGQGPYRGDGASGNKFYEELGYLFSRGAQDFGWHDRNGAHARLSADLGANSLGGSPQQRSLEQYFEQLGLRKPPGPRTLTTPNNVLGEPTPVPGLHSGGHQQEKDKAPTDGVVPNVMDGGGLRLPTHGGAH